MSVLNQVLVTGGAGYIGSHVTLALQDAGYDPIVVDNLSTGIRELVPGNVPFYQGDVGDTDLIKQIISECSINAVIHLAASTSIPLAVSDPLATYKNNCDQSQLFFAALVECSVPHIVFSSSAAVYGSSGNGIFSEDSPKNPANPYGRSKLLCEWMLDDLSKAAKIRHVSLRYFNVAGADASGRTGQSTLGTESLIKVICETALGRRAKIKIFGDDYDTDDGTCIRDFVHVSDVAEAHVAALAYLRDGGSSTMLNCGCHKGYSVLEVIEAVHRLIGRDIPLERCSRRAGDIPVAIADTTRIEEILGWSARRGDLDTIVESALNWETSIDTGQLQNDILSSIRNSENKVMS